MASTVGECFDCKEPDLKLDMCNVCEYGICEDCEMYDCRLCYKLACGDCSVWSEERDGCICIDCREEGENV